MTSAIQPIRVWMAPAGPNPWKPVMLLEELGIPYELKLIRNEEVKKRPYIDVCPNGRVPAIEDPNTDLTLWESGAIMEYIIEQYDIENHFSFATLREKNLCRQWLHFQMSGQGPYFGQLGWFYSLHSEKFPSAIERYDKEVDRVLGVLEQALENKTWLVGEKYTYTDMAFLMWNNRLRKLMPGPSGQDRLPRFPNVDAWTKRMEERPAWIRAMELRAHGMEAEGLQWNGLPKGVSSMAEYEEWSRKRAEAGL